MIRETLIGRLWHRGRQAVSPRLRDRTAEETRLAGVVDRLSQEIADTRADAAGYRLRIDNLENEKAVLQKEVELLALLHERDRERLKADLAIEVQRSEMLKVIRAQLAGGA